MKTNTTSRKRPANPLKTGRRTKEQQINDAYERLGVKPADVEALPKITPIIEKLPSGHRGKSGGGADKAVEFLRGSGEPDARKWLVVYDALPESVRRLLPFEAFCLAAGLSTKRVLEVITGACFEQSSSTSQLLAAASHPTIVEATIRGAKNTQYGGADRKLLHTAAGFLPQSKTQVNNFFGSNAQQKNVQGNDQSQNVTVPVSAVQGLESKMGKIANRFNEKLGLVAAREVVGITDGAEDGVVIEGVVEEDLAEEDLD